MELASYAQVMPVIIVCVLLLIIILKGMRPTFGIAVFAGILLVLLPLCGIPGLAYVPALVLWLGSVGIIHWASSELSCQRRGITIIGFVLAAGLLVALYFVGYQESGRQVSQWDVRESLRTALQFLTAGFGPAVAMFWPYTGLGMLVILLITIGAVLVQAFSNRVERSYARGLMFFILAIASLSLSVGLGRRGYGFTARYFLIATPALCCIYYSWVISRPSVLTSTAQTILFLLLVFLSPFNFKEGMRYGMEYSNSMEAFKFDLLTGRPPSELLSRHVRFLCPCPFGREPTWESL